MQAFDGKVDIINSKMYHPPSKRKQLLQRIAVYSVMSVTIVGLVTVLVFLMLGYRFNRADGSIEQGGLLQFDTEPDGANVTIDGTSFGTRTPSKTTMTAGQHFITMERDGYKKWQKSIDLTAGSVLWLNYARLIPTELTPQATADFSTVTDALASPDDKWMAIKEDAATPLIRVADLAREDAKISDIAIPESAYTKPGEGKSQQFKFSSWDPTGRYLLVQHIYDDAQTEWIVVDVEGSDPARNITTLLDVTAVSPVFSNRDSNILYAIVDGSLRRIDLGATTLSGPLVENVSSFDLYDRATLTYVTNVDPKTKQRSVGYYDEGASKSRTVRTYSEDSGPLQFAIDKYFGDHYVAIIHGQTMEIFEGELPRSDVTDPSSLKTVATLSLPAGADYLSIETNGRFIVAQKSASYTVYDLELKKMTTTKLKGSAAVSNELEWIDGYTVWSDQDNIARLYEFDGANQHDIMPVVSGMDVTLSPSDKYLYGISTSVDGKFHLSRVQLIK